MKYKATSRWIWFSLFIRNCLILKSQVLSMHTDLYFPGGWCHYIREFLGVVVYFLNFGLYTCAVPQIAPSRADFFVKVSQFAPNLNLEFCS